MYALVLATLTLVALALGTSFAHVLEWPAKLRYDAAQYSKLQTSLYVKWGPPNIGGWLEPAAILASLMVAVMMRHQRAAFGLALTAAAMLLLAFPVVFFWRVQPANRVFWAAASAGQAPADWTKWRAQWETGHATRFALHLIAFVLLAAAAMSD